MFACSLFLAFTFMATPVALSTDADVARGKAVYAEQRCSACHSIAGVGNKSHPLDGVGSKLKDAEIRKWIVTPRDMDPKVRKRGFDKLSKADLDALVAYMLSLK